MPTNARTRGTRSSSRTRGPPRVARRPLVGSSFAEDRGLDRELEQPVGVVDLEEPARCDAIPEVARMDEAGSAAHGELVRRRLVLVGVERVPTVLLEVPSLGGIEHEHVQPALDDAHRYGMETMRGIGAADGCEQGGAVRAVEVTGAGGCKIGGGGGEIRPAGGS